jgi:hypothetical protein
MKVRPVNTKRASKADDYQDLIDNPTSYFMRTYFPDLRLKIFE